MSSLNKNIEPDSGDENWLLYDGECPFCSAYVKLVRIRENVGALRLINARSGGPEYDEAMQHGFDLDEGMLLRLNGQYYHGEDCVHALALLSEGGKGFNSINAWVFKSRRRSAVLYPVLRFGRNLVLRLLGRRKMHAPAAKSA